MSKSSGTIVATITREEFERALQTSLIQLDTGASSLVNGQAAVITPLGIDRYFNPNRRDIRDKYPGGPIYPFLGPF